MIIFSHPTGNANSRAAIQELHLDGNLSEFYTSIAAFPGDPLDKLGAIGPFSEIKRRSFHPSLKSVTKLWPWIEVGRLMAAKAGFPSLTRHEKGFFCIENVYKSLDNKVKSRLHSVSKKGVKGVYLYEDGAGYSFAEAKTLGIKCIYDLPIGYWRTARKLLSAEKERWPEWQTTLTGFGDSEQKLFRKDEELRLADMIFVASSFTAKTLEDYPGKLASVKVIPYGFPKINPNRIYGKVNTDKPLKLLFVGGLSQRKGIADIFAAVENLGKKVELTVVGRKATENCPALDQALNRHKWIPSLPHNEILNLMSVHDVLLFPSLFEGFGLVITEAMSQGTPVITTDRTAGPDLIEHGKNGWLIDAGSTEKLQECIEEILNRRMDVPEIGREAMNTAEKRPWEVYGQELSKAISEYLK